MTGHVRAATSKADIDHVVATGRAFHARSIYAHTPYDPDAVAALAERLMAEGGLFVSPGGAAGAALAPLWFAPGVRGAVFLFWYAQDGLAGALRRAVEAWARAQGCRWVQLSGFLARGAALKRQLAREGWAAKELTFLKELD